MVKILKCVAVCALFFLGACGPVVVIDCPALLTAAIAACDADPAGQACTAAKLIYQAKGCGVYVPAPKSCKELKCPPVGSPEKTACAETAEGPACYVPVVPKCPETCPEGLYCIDPKVGCVVKPPPVPVCPTCAEGYICTDPKIGCVKQSTTCDPACKANEKCVERGTTVKIFECVVIPGPAQAPLIPDEELTAIGPAGDPAVGSSQVWGETEAAINRWRALHPEKWRGDGACLISVSGIDEAFLGISTELLRNPGQPIIAGQSIAVGGQRSDCIFANRTGTKKYEEMHLFDYGRACVATGPNAFKHLYLREGNGTVTPPPVTDACPFAPCPDRVWTAETLPPGWGEDRIGTARWRFNVHLHTMGNNDSAPVTDRNEPYCASIGMSPMADGTLRAGCPVRPDGHIEREAVENWLLEGGPKVEGRNGQDCKANNNDNPFAFLAGTGNCRICNTPKTTCSEWQ